MRLVIDTYIRLPSAISIHAPLAGCDQVCGAAACRWVISIHAPLAGCDPQLLRARPRKRDFNPRTPCGVRPGGVHMPMLNVNFNPRTPCGVRRHCGGKGRAAAEISIHAPLAGCDRAPAVVPNAAEIFQSTHPLRGATRTFSAMTRMDGDFNPRTPCGVRPGQ